MTKLDILDTFSKIKICTGYRLNGQEIDYFPSSIIDLAKVEPIYEEFEGWMTSTEEVRSFKDLPLSAQKYVKMIEETLDIPGKKISVLLNIEIKNKSFFACMQ